jgi:large subunit ribosomal protein L25
MDMTVQAKKRDTGTKAKTLRGQGWIPACVYGHHMKSTAVQIKADDVKKLLGKHAAMVTLNIAGMGKVLVGLEEVQKNAFGNELIHISFHALEQNEKANLEVPVEFVGKAKGLTVGGILKEQLQTLTVRGFPKDLPDRILIDVSALDIGGNIHVSDLAGQYKCEFLKEDLEKIIVTCAHPKLQLVPETPVAETAEVAAEATAATAQPAATTAAPAQEKKAA